MMVKLTTAFKERNRTAILFLAGDLAHYLGDAQMPLHTALNHDGQLTNQRGIHAFWETQIPELFGDSYNFHVDDATYINDITAETWKIIKRSHELEDTLLLTEKKLRASFPADEVYKKDSAGKIVKTPFGQSEFSYAYAKAYHEALNGMVESQLRHGIQDVANYWYTAWVNAGKPDLSTLDAQSLTDRNKKNLKNDYRAWQKGKLTDFQSATEF